MRRDMSLVRALLLYLEERSSFGMIEEVEIPSYSRIAIQHHLRLLADGGLITFEAERSTTNPQRIVRVYPFGLTWAGHEFLETIRDPEIWQRTREGAERVGGFSLDLARALAKGFLRKKVEDLTGIQVDL